MKKNIGYGFADHIFHTKKQTFRSSDDNDKGFELMKRLPIFILGITFIIFILRLLTLQVVRGEYYEKLSNENRIKTTLIPAPRGIIFDKNNEALVRNTPTFSIVANDKTELLNRDDALKKISEGELVLTIPQREYLYKDIFSHVVGYIGKLSEEEVLQEEFRDYGYSDFTGRIGVEKQYERLLHGQNGRKLIEVDSEGNYVRTLGEDASIPGKNIKTTLDLEIQRTVFNAMEGVEKGAAVVSDPKTGAILALLSKPTFDPNLFTRSAISGQARSADSASSPQAISGQATGSYRPDGGYQTVEEILNEEDEPFLNRAIAGVYAPGSTFKIVTATAGLEENAIDAGEEIEDTGVRTVGGVTFGTWYYLQYGRKEGFLDIVRAIVRSNDIFFYVLSERIGARKLSDWAGKFGFGKILNIDIPGEVAGIIPGPSWKERVVGEDWYLGDTYNMGIGQGFLQVTPLQINAMTNVIANGGTLYRPHLLPESEKVLREDFIDKSNLDLVRQGMLGACQTGGTGWPFFNFTIRNDNLKIDGLDFKEGFASNSADTKNKDERPVAISVGCKTGTSETFDDSNPHALFTVFAPFYNPEISVTILVEHGGEGSTVAAPIAKEILTDYFEAK